MFRSGGLLYSMPAAEIDVEATEAGEPLPAARPAQPKPERVWRLRASEEERKRILEDLENNHTGSGSQPGPRDLPPALSAGETTAQLGDEWQWRRDARSHEESLRRANEELQMIESRIAQLRSEISSFFSLGYKPSQFTYQTTQLTYSLEQLPGARLEVTRAQRAFEQFQDDARRQGILPGWLR
jgi:hypothetical protein